MIYFYGIVNMSSHQMFSFDGHVRVQQQLEFYQQILMKELGKAKELAEASNKAKSSAIIYGLLLYLPATKVKGTKKNNEPKNEIKTSRKKAA